MWPDHTYSDLYMKRETITHPSEIKISTAEEKQKKKI